MNRWLVVPLAIVAWLILTAVYGFLVLLGTGITFGREGNYYHLACWIIALILWVAATMWAAGLLEDWLARRGNQQ